MRLSTNAALLLGISLTIVSTIPLRAASPGELIEERWEIAQIDGAKVGFLHTTVRRIESGSSKRLRSAAELDLTFKRHATSLRLRREQGTEEAPEGQVVGVFMRQGQEGGRQLVLEGSLEDGSMHVRIDNGRIERRLRWSDEVVGLYRLEHLCQMRKPKPGDRWSLERYDPTYNAVVTLHIAVKEIEEVALLAGAPRVKLLRVEWSADPLEAPGIKVQPPPEVWWLDERFMPARRQIELDGLGTVVLIRTSRETATTAATGGRAIDIGLKTLLPLNRSLVRPYTSSTVVYRLTLRGVADPASALAHDDHQEIRNLRGDTFDLYVHPVRVRPLTPNPSPQRGEGSKSAPQRGEGSKSAPQRTEGRETAPQRKEEGQTAPLSPAGRGVGGEGPEFREPCHFIDCTDSRVKEMAKRAVGAEKDPWAKARRLERWVKQAMRPDNAVPLGPASEVARQLRGDCRQYALLTAALCRAEGIPARVVVGLLYIEKERRPWMGFHMWTEVRIEGRWLGLDSTLGLGGVSAAHIKIADHSWHDTQSLTPLLPANRVLGKMTISVLKTEP